MTTPLTVDPPEFFRDRGRQLRELSSRQPWLDPDARRSFLIGALRDLMGPRDQLLAPLQQAIQRLPIQPANSPDPTPRATLASLHQQLSLTYNAATVEAALAFAEGYLGLIAGVAATPVATGSEPAWPVASPPPPGLPFPVSVVQASSPAARLSVLNLSLVLLTVLASLGVIALLLLREGPPWRQATGGRVAPSAAAPVTAAPAPAPAAPVPAVVAAAPQASGGPLVEMGTASAGQPVRLDLNSIAAAGSPSLRRFRYQLGGQSIEAVADCAAGTWITYPEAQAHSPQSAATARMLERVCQTTSAASLPAAPSPSAAGSGAAIVFDPPSNIRSSPNGAILCSVTSRGAIPIQGREGDWYLTDFCGSPGYIHAGQIRF